MTSKYGYGGYGGYGGRRKRTSAREKLERLARVRMNRIANEAAAQQLKEIELGAPASTESYTVPEELKALQEPIQDAGWFNRILDTTINKVLPNWYTAATGMQAPVIQKGIEGLKYVEPVVQLLPREAVKTTVPSMAIWDAITGRTSEPGPAKAEAVLAIMEATKAITGEEPQGMAELKELRNMSTEELVRNPEIMEEAMDATNLKGYAKFGISMATDPTTYMGWGAIRRAGVKALPKGVKELESTIDEFGNVITKEVAEVVPGRKVLPTEIELLGSVDRSLTKSATDQNKSLLKDRLISPIKRSIQVMNPMIASSDDEILNISVARNRLLTFGESEGVLLKNEFTVLHSNAKKAGGFKLDVDGRVTNAKFKENIPETPEFLRYKKELGGIQPTTNAPVKPPLMADYLQRNDWFKYTKEEQDFFDRWVELRKTIEAIQKQEKLDVKDLIVVGGSYFHRLVKAVKRKKGGKEVLEPVSDIVSQRPFVKPAIYNPESNPQWYEFAEHGANQGIKYFTDPVEAIKVAWDSAIVMTANQRTRNRLLALGEDVTRKGKGKDVSQSQITLGKAKKKFNASNRFVDIVDNIEDAERFGSKAWPIKGKDLRDIQKELGNSDISRLIGLRGPDVSQMITNVAQMLSSRHGIRASSFRAALARIKPKGKSATFEDVTKAIDEVALEAGVSRRSLGRILDSIEIPAMLKVKAIKELREEALATQHSAKRGLDEAERLRKKAISEKKALEKKDYTVIPGLYGLQDLAFKTDSTAYKRVKNLFKHEDPGTVVKSLATVSGASRTVGTTFDLGWHLLQGQPLLATKPKIWVNTFKNTIQSLYDPEVVARIFAEKADVVRRSVRGGTIYEEAGEMVAEGAAGGVLSNLVGKVPLLGRPVRFGMNRLANAFTQSGNMSRLYLYEALEDTALRHGSKGVEDMASFVNKMTGVLASRNLGITNRQQAYETMLLFAPRFVRATFGLMGDAFHGNLRGQLARDSLMKLGVGGTIMYVAIAESAGQEPKLNPLPKKYGGDGGDFMKIKVGGVNLGIGGSILSIMKMVTHITAALDKDPGSLVDPNIIDEDNPFFDYMRTKLSPLSSAGLDVVLGQDYMGEDLDRTTGITWSKDIIGSRSMPFWLDNFVLSNPRSGWGGIAEIFGMNTYPISMWQRRNEVRNKYALQVYQQEWEKLTGYEQTKLKNDFPEIKKAEDRAKGQSERIGDTASRLQYDHALESSNLANERATGLQKVEDEFKAGWGKVGGLTRDGMREKLLEVRSDYYKNKSKLDDSEKYAPLREYWDTRNQEEIRPYADVVFDEYMKEVLDNPKLRDEFDNFNFDLRIQLDAEFKAKHGQEVWDYIKAKLNETHNHEPALMQDFRYLEDNWRPYWEVDREIIKRMGLDDIILQDYRNYAKLDEAEQKLQEVNHPVYKRINKAAGLARNKMKENNKTLDWLLYKFGYSDKLRNQTNIDIKIDKLLL